MSWSDSRGDTGADTGTILAAGCVLWRQSPHGGGLEIALVHRPRYDDWSHPKGKLKPGEDALHGAVREVVEETGMGCAPGAALPTLHYMAKGRPKEVRYWAAEAVDDETFVPNREVDRLLWLPPDAARLRLSYDHDRTLIDALPHALRPS
ncbi:MULTISPECIES: NUDIX hydrolase [Streptomyces]|uniref:NUDIX hydrolase n=1 Tax=Streptomyces TaxID=1883 RepID=UPI001424AEBD|nr:NUDIX hydrolase [Streptomyces sp. AgN23]AJZ86205.1 NUDIX hydrolase [Streptomyces sp. AgN23]WTA82429.1 NUDIX hydrolase [Streptomyces antimycoticus]WTB07044.1 NUDIX hydrolase [Streptomyces antimycoticus]